MGNYHNLPKKVIFCSKCVMSNQKPASTIENKNIISKKKNLIKFSKNGICSACVIAEKKKKIDWDEREKKLIKLALKYKCNYGYNCVVPGSGGKDSSYTSHILKYKYGFNPLTVTWSPNLFTDIGLKNFNSWINVGGHDNILFTPNGKLHKYLTKLSFINLLHPFQPFIIGQKLVGPLIANHFKIPLVFYGENPNEYGNDEIDFNYKMDENFYSSEEINLSKIYLGGVSVSNIIKNSNFIINDFYSYLPIKKTSLIKDLQVHFLGYYLKCDPQERYYYATQNAGYRANDERTQGSYSKYSSIDDKIDYFHYYTTFIKFGLGRASYDASQEIRTNKITRDEGVNLVKIFDNEFPKKYLKDFLDYIGITEKFFFKTIENFRPAHLWKKDKDGKFKLRYQLV